MISSVSNWKLSAIPAELGFSLVGRELWGSWRILCLNPSGYLEKVRVICSHSWWIYISCQITIQSLRCSTSLEALDSMTSSPGCPSVLSMVVVHTCFYCLWVQPRPKERKKEKKGGKHFSAENGKRERECNLVYEIGNVDSFFSLRRIFSFDF